MSIGSASDRELTVGNAGIRTPDMRSAAPLTPRFGEFMALGPHGFTQVAYTAWGPQVAERTVVCVHGLTRNSRDFDLTMDKRDALRYRIAPLEMTPSEFRKTGRQVVERIAEFLCTLPYRPVSPNGSPDVIRGALSKGSLPEEGAEAKDLLEDAATLLFEYSTFNGHPRFMGFISSSAAPIGVLGDMLAAAVNPNVGGWLGAPIGTAIEEQTIRWIAELIGYPTDCGGLLVSGGNMGNFVGLLTARKAKAPWDVRTIGLRGPGSGQLRIYASSETHTWIHKAADMFGLGTEAIRWIPVDEQMRMDTTALRNQIQEDIEAGDLPFLVIGTAGTVSTGAVDPLMTLLRSAGSMTCGSMWMEPMARSLLCCWMSTRASRFQQTWAQSARPIRSLWIHTSGCMHL